MPDKKLEIMFNKFEIVKCFKKDEHTAVYLANHIYLQKEIILKVLNTETIPDSIIIERFKREAKLLARLNHPNIINIYDFGTQDEFFYISFEYFKGTSLRTILNKNKLSLDEKESLVAQMLNGLESAHKHGIIHRDIKPENIFINDNNELKIGDFGLAFEVSDSFVTGQYTIVGTPCYMSPEQIDGKKITARSDLFSLGLVAFELFCGYNLLLGKDINETINNLSSFREEEIFDKIASLPENIRELITNLLRKNESNRIKSAANAIEYLNAKFQNWTPDINKRKSLMTKIGFGLFFITASIIVLILIYTKNDLPPTENIRQAAAIDSTENPVINSSMDSAKIKVGIREAVTVENPNPEIESSNETRVKEPGYGYLQIICFPWAEVYIDSIKIDTTPLNNNLTLREGNHELVLKNPGYPEYRANLGILADQLISIQVKLDTLFGYVNFQIYPWGEIFVDNESVGQTPFREPLKLFPGKYEAVLKNPGAKSKKLTLDITQNDTLLITHNFEIN
ncbi:serine/threonine-protein kinase [Bacteroidota bacterium]